MKSTSAQTLARTFAAPPTSYGQLATWLWNDDIQDDELRRQIQEMHAQGFGGFIPHPRGGVTRKLGYLTPEHFRLLRVAIEEAARLKMKVMLYDEGSYPAGSAHGRVAAENPMWGVHAVLPVQIVINGPAKGYWRPNPGRALLDRLICVTAAKETKDRRVGAQTLQVQSPDSLTEDSSAYALDPSSFHLLTPLEHDMVHYDLPEGTWRLVASWDVLSGATIRGVFAEEEDGHAQAPAAGDIMNPDAVAAFIRITHEQLHHHLGEHFGKTVVAIFTDEPTPFGRIIGGRGNQIRTYTPGLLQDLQANWDEDVHRWLPALWHDCGPRTEEFRRVYGEAVMDRTDRVYYAMVGRWCQDHGLPLGGHVGFCDEMVCSRRMEWPGADTVWWYIAPAELEVKRLNISRMPYVEKWWFNDADHPSALTGPQSVSPKVAQSVAMMDRRRHIGSEVFGAYGWNLTFDVMKWLFDWYLVRGTNVFYPHACFYSMRERRKFESQPDLLSHNVWGRYYGLLGEYTKRLCWLLTDGKLVCDVAVLTDEYEVAWQAARQLFEAQIDFAYIYNDPLGKAEVEGGVLVIGDGRYRAVVFDHARPLTPAAQEKLAAFRKAGGLVLEKWQEKKLAATLAAALVPDLKIDGAKAPGLRVCHYRKADRDFYLLVNEREETIDRTVSLAATGALARWEPLDGTSRPLPAKVVRGRLVTRIHVERRECVVLVVNPKAKPSTAFNVATVPGSMTEKISGAWTVREENEKVASVPGPGDWSKAPGWELFSGTLCYRISFESKHGSAKAGSFLDLGKVGDIAEATLNGISLGVRGWAPYVFPAGKALRKGRNELEVRVTNSMANTYDGVQLPLGLLGPVVWREAKVLKLKR